MLVAFADREIRGRLLCFAFVGVRGRSPCRVASAKPRRNPSPSVCSQTQFTLLQFCLAQINPPITQPESFIDVLESLIRDGDESVWAA